MAKTFLLTGEFPPMQTGIARMMGEVTRRYPRGELLVSTGQHRHSLDSDVRFNGAVVARLPVPSKALRNLAGLLFWSRRVATLAPAQAALRLVRFHVHLSAKWLHERRHEVRRVRARRRSPQRAARHSPFAVRRKTAKALLGSAVAVVRTASGRGNRRRRCARAGLDPLAEHEARPARTDPEHSGPASTRRARYGVNGEAVLTVARLEPYKGVDGAQPWRNAAATDST